MRYKYFIAENPQQTSFKLIVRAPSPREMESVREIHKDKLKDPLLVQESGKTFATGLIREDSMWFNIDVIVEALKDIPKNTISKKHLFIDLDIYQKFFNLFNIEL